MKAGKLLLTTSLVVLVAGAARGELPTMGNGWADLYSGSRLGMDLDFSIGDSYWGFVPEFSAQYGVPYEKANISLGAEFGFGVGDPDHGDAGAWPSSLAMVIKASGCQRQGFKLCYGTQTNVSVNAWEPDSDDIEGWTGVAAGGLDRQLRADKYAPKILAFTPLLALQGGGEMFYAQASLGPSILVLLEDEAEDQVEAALLWSLEMGVELQRMFAAGLALKGNSTLTADDNETFLAMDFTIRLLTRGTQPFLRLSVPLSGDIYEDALDLVVVLGLRVNFDEPGER